MYHVNKRRSIIEKFYIKSNLGITSGQPNRGFRGSAEPDQVRQKTEPNRTEGSAEPFVIINIPAIFKS